MKFRHLPLGLCYLVIPALLIAAEPRYTAVPGLDAIGPAHGDVAITASGDIYVSILGGERGGVQVFNAAGEYVRNVPNAPNDFHGFVIHKEEAGEFIYGTRLSGQTILKMKLDGEVVFEIPGSAIPDELKRQQGDNRILRLTGIDVAPDGRIFAVDGYSTDRIHIFDAAGNYQKSIGGKGEPYGFKTNHKIAIDTRFDPPQILCCDRENRRMVHLSLDGEVLGVTPDMKRPAAVAVHGDWAAVAEIEGRISLLDKEGKTVATLGANDVKEQTATNKVKPEDWREGVLTAPHGVDFDKDGNLCVTEFNQFGRVVRYQLAAAEPAAAAVAATPAPEAQPDPVPDAPAESTPTPEAGGADAGGTDAGASEEPAAAQVDAKPAPQTKSRSSCRRLLKRRCFRRPLLRHRCRLFRR